MRKCDICDKKIPRGAIAVIMPDGRHICRSCLEREQGDAEAGSHAPAPFAFRCFISRMGNDRIIFVPRRLLGAYAVRWRGKRVEYMARLEPLDERERPVDDNNDTEEEVVSDA